MAFNVEPIGSDMGGAADASDVAGSPAAWAAKFAQYLARSAERLSRTAELNKELTQRIARGDVAPVVVDSQLAAFLATNAESYGVELADLTMDFLTKLISANSAYVYALVRSVAPRSAAPERPTPPRFDASDPVDWLERLRQHADAEAAILGSMLRSAIDAAQERQGTPEDGEDSRLHAAVVADIADIFLELLTRLEDINTSYGQRYLTSVLGLARDKVSLEGAMQAAAPLGQTATLRFAVTNHSDSAATVRCVLTDLRRQDGVGPAFEPDAVIMPNDFRLAAGREEVVKVSIRLAEGDFQEGPVYIGEVRVRGIEDAVVDIPLNVRATISADRREPAAGLQ